MADAPMKILVVDDDMFTAELTGLVVESAGYEPVIAEGGIEALAKLAQDPSISLVVSDMNMPLINGSELFSEMRQNGYGQPFILLTGQDVTLLEAEYPSMDAVLQKDENFQENLPKLMNALLAP